MYTCTECGRCQSQCPAWNTGKPLSPKLLIMDLRDHLYEKAPYMLDPDLSNDGNGSVNGHEGVDVLGAMLVGDEPGAEGAVIDYDVLWSCTTCGACVEECPVDIEHVDHIMDMRQFKVQMESSFPQEAGGMLRQRGELRRPVGARAVQAHGVGRWDRRSRRHRLPRGLRVPVLGGLCGGLGGQGEEDHAGDGPPPERRRRLLRHPRPAGVVHRRPGPSRGHGVPVSDGGAAERRAAELCRHPQDHHRLPTLS